MVYKEEASKIVDLEDAIDTTSRLKDKFQKDYVATLEELGTTQQALADSQASVSSLQLRVQKLTLQQEELKDQLDKANIEASEFQKKSAATLDELCTIQKALAESQTSVSTLKRGEQTLLLQQEELKDQLVQAKAQASESEKVTRQLRDQLEASRTHLQSQMHLFNELEQAMETKLVRIKQNLACNETNNHAYARNKKRTSSRI